MWSCKCGHGPYDNWSQPEFDQSVWDHVTIWPVSGGDHYLLQKWKQDFWSAHFLTKTGDYYLLLTTKGTKIILTQRKFSENPVSISALVWDMTWLLSTITTLSVHKSGLKTFPTNCKLLDSFLEELVLYRSQNHWQYLSLSTFIAQSFI